MRYFIISNGKPKWLRMDLFNVAPAPKSEKEYVVRIILPFLRTSRQGFSGFQYFQTVYLPQRSKGKLYERADRDFRISYFLIKLT
jgi:hypothetical protein